MVTIHRLELITLEAAISASAVPHSERLLAAPGGHGEPAQEPVGRAACLRTLLASTAMAAAFRGLAHPAQLVCAPSTRLPVTAMR